MYRNKTAPKVLIVGTVDVDARLDLMCRLYPAFSLSAVGSRENLRPKFEAAGFAYHVCAMSRSANPLKDMLSYWAMLKMFRRLRPDIVHTFDTKPCVLGRLAAWAAGVPTVLGTITGLGTLYADSGLKTRLVRAFYQPLQRLACYHSDLTIFYNREDLDHFVTAGVVPHEKCALVPGSGITTNRFHRKSVASEDLARVRQDMHLLEGEIIVTMIARLCRSKGVLEFAKAAEMVRQELPKVRFVLVGPLDNGAQDGLTATQMDRVQKSVTWLGKRQDIEAILGLSDIFVLPTYYREGIPRVLLEAASMGLPLIATDVPGCREAVHRGVNGFLVPTQDTDALVGAVQQLAGSSRLRQDFGRASRQLAVREFDLDIISKKIASLYDQCFRRILPQHQSVSNIALNETTD